MYQDPYHSLVQDRLCSAVEGWLMLLSVVHLSLGLHLAGDLGHLVEGEDLFWHLDMAAHRRDVV